MTDTKRKADADKLKLEALEALKQRLNEDVATLRQADGDRTPYGGDFESLVTAAQLASQQETDELLRRRLERALGHREGEPAGGAGAVRRLRVLRRRAPRGRLAGARNHHVRPLPEQGSGEADLGAQRPLSLRCFSPPPPPTPQVPAGEGLLCRRGRGTPPLYPLHPPAGGSRPPGTGMLRRGTWSASEAVDERLHHSCTSSGPISVKGPTEPALSPHISIATLTLDTS